MARRRPYIDASVMQLPASTATYLSPGVQPGLEVAAHEALPDPHPGYLTPAEGDAAYAPRSLVSMSYFLSR
jgi:hypothetical protein